MKKVLLAFWMALVLFWPATALANAAEPPGFILHVLGAPADLQVRLVLPEQPLVLLKEPKAWETHYRFYYHELPMERGHYPAMTLQFVSGDHQQEVPLPKEAFKGYYTILTYDYPRGELTLGESPGRTELLVALRVFLTLLLEGAVFYLFGYRQKRSWAMFLLVNLVTQGGLNIVLSGPGTTDGGYWLIAFLFLETVIFLAEAIALPFLLKEHTRRHAVVYALSANLVSLILGGVILSWLPV